jgi:hypothetical protein
LAAVLGSSYDAREVTTTTTKHSRSDEDGIRVIDTRAPRKRGWIAIAAVVAGAAAVVLIAVLARAPVEPATRAASAAAEPEVGAAPDTPAPVATAEKPRGKPSPRAAAPPPPTQEEEERALERKLADEPSYTIAPPGSPKSGMALFPPPGSDPLLRGIIVPEDFPLPEGYVRHHQVTDDGQPLPAILMFHPDYDWVDDSGEPIEVPADRVVPPELAPEDMPIEILSPPDAGESRAGSSS